MSRFSWHYSGVQNVFLDHAFTCTDKNVCVLVLLLAHIGSKAQNISLCVDFGTVCDEFKAENSRETGKPQSTVGLGAFMLYCPY